MKISGWILIMWNISDRSCREKHTLISMIFFIKSHRLRDNVGEYGGERQATDDNKYAHVG